MADQTTVYTLTDSWSGTNRYTAGSDVDVNLSNASRNHRIAWAITSDNTAPTIAVASASMIKPSADKPMQLLTGERLWMAYVDGPADAALTV